MSSKNEPDWVQTVATVSSCTYQFARMSTLSLGVQTGKKFRIAFDYYAHGRMYSGEFQSAVAIPQDERIRVRYNPRRPEQNDRSGGPGAGGSGVMAIGVLGSLVLSLLWLTFYRGCN